MNRAVKFRIYPDKEQEQQLAKTFGCCRFLYNRMLEDKIRKYEKGKKMLRNTPAAYRIVVNGNIRLEEGKLKLPKLTPVKVRQHREIPESYRLKSVTVSREASGKYYASLLYTYENQVRKQEGKPEKIFGVDFAMSGLAVFSDGTRAEYPMYYKRAEQRLAIEQRGLSRCVRGSRNYAKQKKRVAVCHDKVRNQRRDYQHKLSWKLAECYDAVCVKDLNMKHMSQSLHLGKGVMDNSFGRFREMLCYKLELSERIYVCECGNRMDRDVNAAVNIREEGLRMLCA